MNEKTKGENGPAYKGMECYDGKLDAFIERNKGQTYTRGNNLFPVPDSG